MGTVNEIGSALTKLTTPELVEVERLIHGLYRQRGEVIIYDDAYGVWTEADQTSAAAEAFALMDKSEEQRDGPPTR